MKMMKSLTKAPDYCNYSFDDLYKAAFGKSLNPKEKERLQKMPQDKINSCVLEWALKAEWKTKEKIGSDNKVYLVFYP